MESPLVYSSWKDHCSKNSTPIPATSQSTTSETQPQAVPRAHMRTRRSRNGPTTSGGAQSQTHIIEPTPSRSHDMPLNDEGIAHNSQDIPHGVRITSHPAHDTSHDSQESSHDTLGTSQHIQGTSHNIQTPLCGSTSSQPLWSLQRPSYHINSLPRTTNFPVSNTFPIPRVPFPMPHPTTYHPPYQPVLSPFHTPPGPVLTPSQQLPSQIYNCNVGLNTQGLIWNPHGEQNSDQ